MDPAARYGEQIAEIYDDLYEHIFEADETARCLAELANGGRALELGIGTGRIALRLARLGVDVRGIDASPAMVSKLRDKPGGEAIEVTIGDFADVDVEGEYDLVFAAFNTLFALTTQEDQIRCFHNSARKLAAAGAFVVEAFVPDPARFTDHQRVSVERIYDDRVLLEVSRHDPVRQRVDSRHLLLGRDGTESYPVEIRYASPAELDLMARLASLELDQRWGGWDRSEFTSESRAHVSVYRRKE